MVPRLSFVTYGDPNRRKFDVFLHVVFNLKTILCCLLLQYLLFVAIVCCYFPVFNACWLLSSAYGCVRLTLPSQRLVKSFVTDGAKIVFCNFWRSESTQSLMFSFVSVNIKIILCCLLLQYLLFIAKVCCYIPVFNACWLLSSA